MQFTRDTQLLRLTYNNTVNKHFLIQYIFSEIHYLNFTYNMHTCTWLQKHEYNVMMAAH